MLKLIIVDDEAGARETIRNIVELSQVDLDVIGEAHSVESAHKLINDLHPDLVLLDINLTDGSGFDLLKRFEKISFRVIFITAHEDYAISAFRYSAMDYIMKPVRAGDLLSAIERTGEAIEKDQMSVRLDTLLSNIDRLRKIVLKTSESIHIIHVEHIIRCEADVNYTHFYLNDEKHLIVSKPLKDYAEMLEPAGFFRTHQSHLINMEHILRYDRSDGGCLVMDDESCVPVSSRKKEALFRIFEQMQ
jgi:two-component system LytT family response regulator